MTLRAPSLYAYPHMIATSQDPLSLYRSLQANTESLFSRFLTAS